MGNVFLYSIEWGKHHTEHHDGLKLVAKIIIHTQQICGIAWSADGEYFATGGNDNVCLLLCTRDILTTQHSAPTVQCPLPAPMTGMVPDFVPNASSHFTLGSMLGPSRHSELLGSNDTTRRIPRSEPNSSNPVEIYRGRELQCWTHAAAVKAIAFCPWQKGLLATGGGSNDRAIHFYHAWSGACLATINVSAQVTSLIWSNTRREIAATFGYSQPEHPYRIAVFSWPECQQVVSIPWGGDLRALYAVAYPGGPNESKNKRSGEGERWWRRTAEEGCIVVASSDESVKFQEVWSEGGRATGFSVGGLGWSDILEELEGEDKEGSEIIR